ncbi:MAG: phosphate signaling complex protein PhoU [Anaerolineae bacterium]
MLRQTFDRELQRLQDDMLVVGRMVEKALIESVEILKRRDLEGARRLIAGDQIINEKRFAIEADCLALIATQQPVASDLRTLAGVLEIITELERIGDYAKGIARTAIMTDQEPLLKPLTKISDMAEKTRNMLNRALEAFVQRDVALARAISAEDDEVDALYSQVYRGLLSIVMADTGTIDQAAYLLSVAHNLERTSDRVINICERVIFTVTGEMVELDAEDAGIESIS